MPVIVLGTSCSQRGLSSRGSSHNAEERDSELTSIPNIRGILSPTPLRTIDGRTVGFLIGGGKRQWSCLETAVRAARMCGSHRSFTHWTTNHTRMTANGFVPFDITCADATYGKE